MALAPAAAMTLPAGSTGSGATVTGGEAALIRACRRGDEDAFATLVRRHQDRVFRLVGRFFRERDDIEELAQETFVTVWRKLHTYRGDAPFEHWLTRVCLNCCFARLRRSRPIEPLEERHLEVASGDPDARLDAHTLLSRLPPQDRFLLLLLHGEGWSTDEIARRLGWTRTNVKVRAHRARKRLRRLVEKESSP